MSPYISPEEIAAARAWLADNSWENMEPEDIEELRDLDVIWAITRVYDGGWPQFRRDSEATALCAAYDREVVCAEQQAMQEALSGPIADARELDAREGDGLTIRLLWNKATGRTYVHVTDARLGTTNVIRVPKGGDAYEVFNHPYAYA